MTTGLVWMLASLAPGEAPPLTVGPDPGYAPRLAAPVFNVKDYGALGDDTGDDTDAVRAALAACRLAGGGTVYLPAGIYRVAPKEANGYAFPLHFGNLTIEGDGPTKTTLNFRAWGMQDPASLILKRGGGFTTAGSRSPIDGITLRGFRATGNAPPTKDAGKWTMEGHATGWDITHKGLGIWGTVTNLVVEDSEWDNWRGEVLYSGGGLELGEFTIRRTVVRGANASAISMGGDVLVEDSEIFDVHNATECMSMGGHAKLAVRRCQIEVNRNFPADMKIGTFGIVYLGFRASSLVVEDCLIGATNAGGVFLSEAASNVTIRNNTFEDTTGVYMIYLNQYAGHTSIPASEHNHWENIGISDNLFRAKTRNIESAILSYASPGKDWRLSHNEVRGTNGFRCGSFIRTNGATGEYVASNNIIADANPADDSTGPRPVWIDNVVEGDYYRDGSVVFSYNNPADPTPVKLRPTWPKIRILDVGGGVMTRPHRVDPTVLPLLPADYPLEIRRAGPNDILTGAEIRPDPAWNTLTRGYMLYRGALLKLRKGASGLLDLESYTPPEVNIRTLTAIDPNRPNLQELSFYGQREVILAPKVRHVFTSHSGVAIGDTVKIRHNELTTIAHVPGVVEIFNDGDFVATAAGTLQAKREGEVLLISPNVPPRRVQGLRIKAAP